MYPDLSYILNELFGTPTGNWTSIVKTFGLFLGMAFIVAHYFFKEELTRKEVEKLLPGVVEEQVVGEAPSIWQLALRFLVGFLIGFKFVKLVLEPELSQGDILSFLFSWNGDVFGGFLIAMIFGGSYWYESKRRELPESKTETFTVMPSQWSPDFTFRAAVAGIIGAKIFAILESKENFLRFLEDPVGTFLSGSGLAIYGGVIVAFCYCSWWVKRKGVKAIHIMDAVAPALAIGYAVGRLGCHFSGDGDWGIPNLFELPSWWFLPEYLWAYDYPHNVLEQGILIEGCEGRYCHRLPVPVYPTPLYEIGMSLIIFLILWVRRRKTRIAGSLFSLYLILSSVERFVIESIRVNDKIDLGHVEVTQAEIISVLLFVIGILLLFSLRLGLVKRIDINSS